MNTWHESLASCSAPQENQYSIATLFPPQPQKTSPAATTAASAAATMTTEEENEVGEGDNDSVGAPPDYEDEEEDHGDMYRFGCGNALASAERGEGATGPGYGQELGQRYQRWRYY